jgi:hypothetical protein
MTMYTANVAIDFFYGRCTQGRGAVRILEACAFGGSEWHSAGGQRTILGEIT